MNFEDLNKLSFQSGEELSNYLKGLAKRNGFKIYQKDSKTSNRIRFYCSYHQMHKDVKNTNKIGCNFHLSFNKNANGIYILSKNSNFTHLHNIEIEEYDNLDEVQEDVICMKKIGISNYHVIMYIESKYNISLTRYDISKMLKEDPCNVSETEQINNYMDKKGKCFIFEDSNCNVAGIYTITYEEIENFKLYGDFLVIDGTTIPNFLEWTIVPISLQGNNMELLSGGIAFTSSENSEFYEWLIGILSSFSSKLKCIISDEDTAICSAMENFQNIYHFLCIKHKIAHIHSLVKKNNKNIDRFNELVNNLFYSRSKNIVMESLSKIYELFPEVINYFETNVFVNRYKLLVSMRPNVFVFNHTSSQLGESYNNMIKRNLTNKINHLWEIREHVSNTFRIKKNNDIQIKNNAHISNHFIFNQYGINLSKRICNKLDFEIFHSQKIIIEQIDDDTWVAKENENMEFKLNFNDCECKYTIQAGLPCRHIIALYDQLVNDFPCHLIYTRLYKHCNNDAMKNTIISIEEEEEDVNDPDYIYVDEEEDEYEYECFEEKENLINEINLQNKRIGNENNRSTINIRTELMQITKEITNIGSNPEIFENVKNDLEKILHKYQVYTIYGETIERRGKRRGRPKLRKFSLNSPIK